MHGSWLEEESERTRELARAIAQERAGEPEAWLALSDAVDAARGKFLIDWRSVTDAAPELLAELADHLEDDPDSYAAAVESGRHPMLWRRWSMLDPQAEPDGVVKAGTGGAGPPLDETAYLGAFPNPRWSVDSDRFKLPLRQVRPETEGRFPEWLP